MKKMIVGLLMAFLLLLGAGGGVSGQTADTPSGGEETKYPATIDILFNRIQVLCRGGESHYGLLAGVTDRGLVVRLEGKDEIIPYDRLEKVAIEKKRGGSSYGLSGMAAGLYAGHILFFGASSRLPFYLEKQHGDDFMYFWNPVFAAVGGGLGMLFGLTLESGERVFDFEGDGEKQSEQWRCLQKFVIGEHGYINKKIHLTLQGGLNFPRVSDRYKSLLEKSGYRVDRYAYDSKNRYWEPSNFNMLRKVQLTYSLTSKTEAGLAAYFMGEPLLQGYSYDYSSSVPRPTQSIDTKGYYAVAAFYPFRTRTFKRLDWSVGIGVGVADVDFHFVSSSAWGWWLEGETEGAGNYHLSKKLASGVVFSELKFYIQRGFSIGLVADYVYVSKVGFPEFPGAGIPAQSLSPGNSSVGFTLGLHL